MELTEEAGFFRTVLRCVADGVFTVDPQWRITSFNTAAEKITGVSAAEAIGRRCSEVFHADICGNGCAIRRTLDTGAEVVDEPARLVHQRGRSVPVRVSSAVLRADDGTVLGAVESFRDLSAVEALKREVEGRYTVEDIVGRSEALQRIFAVLPDVAASESTVLVEGPSGSGKELLARAIHNMSPRHRRPFVVVRCATLPPGMCESELFGYRKGAFTEALTDTPGRVAMAEGGTVFIDEVGDLQPATQVKLLRLLQERIYEPVGAQAPRQGDVRVVVGTTRSLPDLVSRGRFRDDLYFRLAVVRLSVPPLSDRREDIPLLVEHFIQRLNGRHGRRVERVSPEVMRLLMRHELPGNARELENIIEHAFVLCRGGPIEVQHLPAELEAQVMALRTVGDDPWATPLHKGEAEVLRCALRHNRGHQTRAAEELGISRTTLWRKLKRHGIRAGDFR